MWLNMFSQKKYACKNANTILSWEVPFTNIALKTQMTTSLFLKLRVQQQKGEWIALKRDFEETHIIFLN